MGAAVNLEWLRGVEMGALALLLVIVGTGYAMDAGEEWAGLGSGITSPLQQSLTALSNARMDASWSHLRRIILYHRVSKSLQIL